MDCVTSPKSNDSRINCRKAYAATNSSASVQSRHNHSTSSMATDIRTSELSQPVDVAEVNFSAPALRSLHRRMLMVHNSTFSVGSTRSASALFTACREIII